MCVYMFLFSYQTYASLIYPNHTTLNTSTPHYVFYPAMTLEHLCHICLGTNLLYSTQSQVQPQPGTRHTLEEPRPEHMW